MLLCALLCPASLFGQAHHKGKASAFRVDLRRLGVETAQGPMGPTINESLAFMEDGSLAVLAFKRETASEQAPSFPTFTVLIIDTQKGTIRQSWKPTISPWWLFATHSGLLLLAAGNVLELYLPTGERLATNQLEFEPWRIELCVGGRSLLMRSLDSGSTLVDALTLKPLTFGTESTSRVVSCSATRIAKEELSGVAGSVLFVRRPLEDWRQVRGAMVPPCAYLSPFISEKTLVFDRCDGSLALLDLEANSESVIPLGNKHYRIRRVSPSKDSRRFAVLIDRMRFIWMPFEGSGRFYWTESVAVIDVNKGRVIHSKKLKVSWWFGPHFNGSIALSPDGQSLAILNNGLLEVFRLPPS